MKNCTKQKSRAGQCFVFLLYILLGLICGFVFYPLLERSLAEGSYLTTILLPFLFLAIFFTAIVLQILLHETGHLVFGLLSGYKFCSFRIFSLLWVKEKGKLRLKRLSLAGTGGQCLMAPPDPVNGRFPVMLYNFGGALMNVLTGTVFLLLFLVFRHLSLLSVFLFLLAVTGFFFAVINSVPLRLNAVDSDGYKAFSLQKEPEAMRAFWIQMKVNELLLQGIRLKDMPAEFFVLPETASLENSMVAALGVLACSRFMDAKQFREADALMDRLLATDSGIVGVHRGALGCDRLYLSIIGQSRCTQPVLLLTKEQKDFMKAMKNNPSVLRTNYVYALYIEKDSVKAAAFRAQFEKCAKTYPAPVEIQAERELIEFAAKVWKTW